MDEERVISADLLSDDPTDDEVLGGALETYADYPKTVVQNGVTGHLAIFIDIEEEGGVPVYRVTASYVPLPELTEE